MALAAIATVMGSYSVSQRGSGRDAGAKDADTSTQLFHVREAGSLRSLTADPNLAFIGADRGRLEKAIDQAPLVVVDVWASWCGPCKAIKPQLEVLQQEFKDRGVLVVGLSPQPIAELEKTGWKSHGSAFVLGVGAERFINHHKVEAYPTILLFKGDQVIERYEGSDCIPQLKSDLVRFSAVEPASRNVYDEVFVRDLHDERLSALQRPIGGGALSLDALKKLEEVIPLIDSEDERVSTAASVQLLKHLKARRDLVPTLISDLGLNLSVAFQKLSAVDQIDLIGVLRPAFAKCAEQLGSATLGQEFSVPQSRQGLYLFVMRASRTTRNDEVRSALRTLSGPLSDCATHEPDSEAGSWAYVAMRRVEAPLASKGVSAAIPSEFARMVVDPQHLATYHPGGKYLATLSSSIVKEDARGVTQSLSDLMSRRDTVGVASTPPAAWTELLEERRCLLGCLTDVRFSRSLLHNDKTSDGGVSDRLVTHLAQTLSDSDPLRDDTFHRTLVYAAIVRIGADHVNGAHRQLLERQLQIDRESDNLDLARRADHLKRELAR